MTTVEQYSAIDHQAANQSWIVRHSKRPLFAGDLETSFADNRLNLLKKSGVPARAPQGLRLAGMTVVGVAEAT